MKKLLALLLAVIMTFSLVACGRGAQNNEEKQTKTVTDVLGRQVEVPVTVTRIAALGNAPRQLVYLGLADKIVGISKGYDVAADADPCNPSRYVSKDLWNGLPVVGSGDAEGYHEELMKVAPDVLICTFPADVADDIQTKTGVPVVCIQTSTLFGDDYDASWKLIGEVCGVQERADALIKFVDDCLADLEKRTKDIPADKRPTCLSAAASFKGAHGIEGVRLKDKVLDAVNANNVATLEDAKGSSVEVEKEQIIAWNPEIIFCDASNVHLVTDDQKANPVYYDQLQAFKNQKIYQHPNSTFQYSNVEVPIANAYFIGSILYPEQFADVDYKAKANEIFKFFLNVDNYLAELEAVGMGYGVVEFNAN